MATSHEDLLAEAERLLGSNEEVDLRKSADLAYYSVYHAVKPLLLKVPKGKSGVHSKQIAAFIDNPDKKMRTIGYLMNKCRTTRVDAVYDLDEDFGKTRAEDQLTLAKRILRELEEVSVGATEEKGQSS